MSTVNFSLCYSQSMLTKWELTNRSEINDELRIDKMGVDQNEWGVTHISATIEVPFQLALQTVQPGAA